MWLGIITLLGLQRRKIVNISRSKWENGLVKPEDSNKESIVLCISGKTTNLEIENVAHNTYGW